MIQLRTYQAKSVHELIPASFKAGHRRIIRTAPTGSGKSLEMAELTRLTYEKGNRVMLLTHRKELFKSTLAHIGRASIPCAELSAGKSLPMGDWRVLLAMEKTLWNVIRKNPSSILPPSLIIVDEGHFNNFTKIIQYFKDSFVITFTATPQGKHISKLYTDIIDNIGIPELIEQNYLTPCKPFMMQDTEGFEKVKKKGDDFDSNELFKHCNTANRYKGVLDEYLSRVKGQKGICFCVNVEHTIATYKNFKDAGVNVFLCHSNMTDADRDYNVLEFESSSDGLMINCGILTTGYSHDPIAFGIIDRATTSLPLWLQMQGRCSRIHPGKKYFTILDFGDNHTRLGLWNQKREWSLVEKKRTTKLQPMSVRTCHSCGAMLPARQMKCEFCGHEIEKPETELKDGVMVEYETNIPISTKGKRISECSIEDLINLQKTKKLKHSYVWRVLRTRESELKEESKQEGISPLYHYADLMKYKSGWVFSERKKIIEGQVGYSNYIIK